MARYLSFKNLILIPAVFLAMVLFVSVLSKPVLADDPGTFGCGWNDAQQSCGVDTSSVTCGQGYIPAPPTCSQRTQNDCKNGGTAQCVVSGTTFFSCDNSGAGCVADPNGTFQDIKACSVNCKAEVVAVNCPKGCSPTGACAFVGGVSCDCHAGGNPLAPCNSTACDPANPNYFSSYVNVGGKGWCLTTQHSQTPVYLCLSGQSCQTAIGNITADPKAFAEALFRLILGVSGSIAILMFILAGYQILTSSGDPQKLAAGKELFAAVIGGIFLIVFSLVILQAVGVDILGLQTLLPTGH